MLNIGTVVEDRYKIIEKVGTGGTSDVYLVQHMSLQVEMAMKVIFLRDTDTQDFSVEVHHTKDLKHPNLPRIIDIFKYENHLCIVRDFIKGETLQAHVDRNGPLDIKRILHFVKQIIAVIHYLHSQPIPIVYRDLKPSNLIINENDDLFLIDFGTTRKYKSQNDSDTLCLGTRGYAAPEQYGGVQTDARTDIYALGATLYYMTTGEHVFEVPHLDKWQKFRSEDGKLLKTIIEKAMSLNPDDRFQTVFEIEQNLNINQSQANIGTVKQASTTPKRTEKLCIAVMGANKGCGVTHNALAFAKSCTKQFKSVHFVERHPDCGVVMLERWIEEGALTEDFGNTGFKYAGINFEKEVTEADFLKLISTSNQSVVIDYGSAHFLLADFLRAQYKFFILPANPWALSNFAILKELAQYDDIHYIVNLSNGTTLQQISRWYNIKKSKLSAVSFLEQPLVYSKDHLAYDKLLGFTNKKRFISKLWR